MEEATCRQGSKGCFLLMTRTTKPSAIDRRLLQMAPDVGVAYCWRRVLLIAGEGRSGGDLLRAEDGSSRGFGTVGVVSASSSMVNRPESCEAARQDAEGRFSLPEFEPSAKVVLISRCGIPAVLAMAGPRCCRAGQRLKAHGVELARSYAVSHDAVWSPLLFIGVIEPVYAPARWDTPRTAHTANRGFPRPMTAVTRRIRF